MSNIAPFTNEEIERIRELVNAAVEIEEKHNVRTLDGTMWKRRFLATVDALKAKLPPEEAPKPQEDDA